MGCDIHIHIEYKDKKSDKWKQYYWYDNYKDKSGKIDWNKVFDDDLHIGRDYDLFGLLADVRNYDDIPSICLPRGLPDDVSDSVYLEYKEWDCDGHSHSYYTLSELKDYPWEKKYKKEGLVSKKSYEEYICSGRIREYCRNAFGNIKILSEEEMKEIAFRNDKDDCDGNIYCRLVWYETMEVRFSYFYNDFLNKIRELFPNHSDDELRLVFWFDN